jgi:hypothetical protein
MPARRSDPSGEGTHHRFVRRDCAPWSTPLDEVMHTLDMLAAQDELVPEELFEMHSAQGCSVDRRDVCLTEATSPRYRRSFPKQSSDVSLTHGCAGQIGRRRPTKIMSMIISRAPSCDCSVTRSAAIYILVAGMRKLAQRTRQRDYFPVDESTIAIKIPVSTNKRIHGASGFEDAQGTRTGGGLMWLGVARRF